MTRIIDKQAVIDEVLAKYKVKCKCGHTMFISKQDKKLCDYCGKYVFRDKKAEFMYRMKERMNK